jgi:peroxiredoxin (alkyl hydroperoxide reductase subunit C)
MNSESVCCGLKVGQSVPAFEMDTYDPTEMFFGKVSLEQLKKDGKWTILFFYPADFTFV